MKITKFERNLKILKKIRNKKKKGKRPDVLRLIIATKPILQRESRIKRINIKLNQESMDGSTHPLD